MMTICIPCGYIYEGKLAFEFLPDEWCCPDCGVSINCFEEVDESLHKDTEQVNAASEMALMKSGKP